MTNGYRPFFNRKFLNGLMLFCVLAILVLTSMGPGKPEFQKIQHNDQKSLYWMELDDQPLIFSLMLPTATALNPRQQQLQHLKAKVLLSVLDDKPRSFSYSVTPRQDRIEINLGWASEQQTPDFSALMEELRQPVKTDEWQSALEKLQAQEYLQNQDIENRLINNFMQALQPADTTEVLQRLTQSYPKLFTSPRFAISGEDADEIAEQISELKLAEQKQSFVSPLPLVSNTNSLPASDQRYHLLLGQQTAARSAKNFLEQRLVSQVIQDLLQEYADQFGMEYRLVSTSLADTGYRLILLHGSQNPAVLLPQLQQLISEARIERSQQALNERWEEQMRDLRNQIQALNLIAFYGLEADTMEEYGENMLDLDPDDIAPLVTQALQIEQQFSILQPPQH